MIFSYNIWLHAMYGEIADDFAPFNQAWTVIENYLIPQAQYNQDKCVGIKRVGFSSN